MKHSRKLIVGFLATAIALPWFCTQVDAQSPTALCVEVYNPATGGESCVPGWIPKLLNGLSTTVTSVKNSAPGQLSVVYCANPNSSGSMTYIQIFDVATAAGVTLGITTPTLSLGIPGTQSSGIGPSGLGVVFQNGIQVAVTTTATGNTAPSTAMDCNVTYN